MMVRAVSVRKLERQRRDGMQPRLESGPKDGTASATGCVPNRGRVARVGGAIAGIEESREDERLVELIESALERLRAVAVAGTEWQEEGRSVELIGSALSARLRASAVAGPECQKVARLRTVAIAGTE